MLVVELRQTHGQFAAARARRRHHNQRPRRLDILVFAVALVRHNKLNVVWVAIDFVVAVRRDSQLFQPLFEPNGCGLVVEFCQANAAHHQPHAVELVNQAQNVLVVGYAIVGADFVRFDIFGVDSHHNLDFILEFQQHLHFRVGMEARQHTRCVIVVEQLAADFQIKFVAEFGYPLFNMRRLHTDVLVVIESDFIHNHSIKFYFTLKFSNSRSPIFATMLSPIATGPTPTGVPVKIKSPILSVKNFDI